MGNTLRGFMGNLCGGKESSKRNDIEENTPSGTEPIEYKPPVTTTTDGKESSEDTDKNLVEANGDQSNHIKHSDSSDLNKSATESPRPKKGSLKGIHKLHEVEHIQLEELGVEDIDKVFRNGTEIYGLFVEHTHEFRNAVIDFEKRFTNVNKKTDFEKCFESYLKSLDKQNSKEKTDETSEKDEISIHTLIQNIKKTGDRLLETINSTRPKLDENILENEQFNPKEYLKGSIKEGGQQTLLTKSSVPSNHRKNLKTIKKARKLLDDVFSEVEAIRALISQVLAMAVDEIVDQIDNRISEEPAKEALNNDEVKVIVDVNDIETNLQKEVDGGNETAVNDEAEQQPPKDSPVIAVIDVSEPEKEPEVNKPIDDEKNHEREKADEITELPLPLSPITGILHRRADSWDTVALDDEGRLVDYGSFLVLDPSADDIVLMRRSRSLDSLSSLGSRRSMSRYGSYEMVTNFEITIAEKGEANRAVKKIEPTQLTNTTPPLLIRRLSDPAKMTRPKLPVSPSSPRIIYKYTELDSNPLWL